jgi:hypothetical protein
LRANLGFAAARAKQRAKQRAKHRENYPTLRRHISLLAAYFQAILEDSNNEGST